MIKELGVSFFKANTFLYKAYDLLIKQSLLERMFNQKGGYRDSLGIRVDFIILGDYYQSQVSRLHLGEFEIARRLFI